jgi:gliding motility-associated lipoprotein GldH
MNVSRHFPPCILLLLVIPLITSCDSKRFYEDNKRVENGVWNRNDRIRFEVEIRDTLARYDFYLKVRNAMDYPFSNLYLFIHTKLPDGVVTLDTAECQLADYSGKWLGSGMGSVKFNRLLYMKGVRFRKAGTYEFAFEQAMRVADLRGIRDVGIRIEKE